MKRLITSEVSACSDFSFNPAELRRTVLETADFETLTGRLKISSYDVVVSKNYGFPSYTQI